MRLYDTAALSGWLARAFAACGLAPDAAGLAAQVLVRTNARGVETHGISRALVYVQKLQSGELTARPNVRYEDRAGVLHCHADSGLGQVVASRAVGEAIGRAATAGFVPMVIHDVGHLAALGMFALQAAEAGMIALVAQSTPPIMALPGSKRAAIGNNPLAFASPVAGGPPLVFDLAASGVARGNVLAAAREKREIPLGWAIDADGNPTTDPKAALSGAMLPMAGHKGIGLAMMVQCLAGSLSGALPATVTGAAPGSAPARGGAVVGAGRGGPSSFGAMAFRGGGTGRLRRPHGRLDRGVPTGLRARWPLSRRTRSQARGGTHAYGRALARRGRRGAARGRRGDRRPLHAGPDGADHGSMMAQLKSNGGETP